MNLTGRHGMVNGRIRRVIRKETHGCKYQRKCEYDSQYLLAHLLLHTSATLAHGLVMPDVRPPGIAPDGSVSPA
jgi:hypothetical protein